MTKSIGQGSKDHQKAYQHADGNDDAEPSIATVVTSLKTRSNDNREAWEEASIDGDVKDGDAFPSPASFTVEHSGQEASSVRFPLPEPHSAEQESAKNAKPNRESNPKSARSPATRSNFHQTIEKQGLNSSSQPDSRVWDTKVGHNGAFIDTVTLSNRVENRPEQWVTQLGHKRSARGLSLRGSVYQFRVRVPLMPGHSACPRYTSANRSDRHRSSRP